MTRAPGKVLGSGPLLVVRRTKAPEHQEIQNDPNCF